MPDQIRRSCNDEKVVANKTITVFNRKFLAEAHIPCNSIPKASEVENHFYTSLSRDTRVVSPAGELTSARKKSAKLLRKKCV